MLQDPDDPEHWMVRDLPGTAGTNGLSEDDVAAMARDPDRRHLTDERGGIWRIERIEKPEAVREDVEFERAAVKVRISSEGGPPRLAALPDGRTLGTMSREALIGLIEEE